MDYRACARVGPEGFACEKERGHEGKCGAFVNDDDRQTVAWEAE